MSTMLKVEESKENNASLHHQTTYRLWSCNCHSWMFLHRAWNNV